VVAVAVAVEVSPSGPTKRIRPLKRRDVERGEVPNHSSSSVREDVMEWPVSSANLRFSGVFHVPGCSGGDDSYLIGGVGTRGSGSTMKVSTGVGGRNAFAGQSLVYRLGTSQR